MNSGFLTGFVLLKKILFWKCLAKFEFINMPITKPSLISRRNFSLTGAHHSALINTLTLGTSLFMYNKTTVHKMGTEEIYRLLLAAPSLISRPIHVWKLQVDYKQ